MALSLGTADLRGPSPTSPPTPDPASPFAQNLRVTDNSLGYPWQVEPSMAVDSTGVIHLGWKEALTDSGSGKRVGYSRSVDGGQTWAPGTLMPRYTSQAFYSASDPWLVVDENDTAYYARLDYADLNGYQDRMVVSRSQDRGASWGPLDVWSEPTESVDKEAMTSDGQGNLYGVYRHWNATAGETQGRVTDSSDQAQTWRAPMTKVNDGLGYQLVKTTSGVLLLAYLSANYDTVVVRSLDGGKTFGSTIRVNDIPNTVSPPPTPQRYPMPWMTMDSGGAVFLAWPDRRGGDLDIYVDRSDDGGLTWGTDVLVNGDPQRDQWMPTLAVDSADVLHLIWEDNRTGDFDVYYSNSTDGGATWLPDLKVTTMTSPSAWHRPGDYLAMAVGPDDTVHIAWTDGRDGDWNIYYARSTPPPAIPGAASNVWADLEGVGDTDVRVRWDLSPDDATRVDHYTVVYGTAYDPSAASYVPLPGCTVVAAGTATCAHPAAGDGDPASYFYAVRADAALAQGPVTATQGAKFTRLLGSATGPRSELLSVPVLTGTAPFDVMRTYPSTILRTYVASDGGDPWKASMSFKAAGKWDLTAIDTANGVWAEAPVEDLWAVAGQVPPITAIPLVPGWNLVGYPGFTERPVAVALAGLWGSVVTRVEGYDSRGPYFLRSLGGGDALRAGYGYWVYATSAATWLVTP